MHFEKTSARRTPGAKAAMTSTGRSTHTQDPVTDHEQKRVALGYLQEAWAEARLDGIDGDCLAQACLFAALAEFVPPMARKRPPPSRKDWARASATVNSRLISHGSSRPPPGAWRSTHYRMQAEMALEQRIDVGRIERLLQEGERTGGPRTVGDRIVER